MEMMVIDVGAIVLSLLGMMSAWLNWWLDRKRHKQEVKNLEAQAKEIEANVRHKDMELAELFVKDYQEIMVKKLREDVDSLKCRVYELENAIQKFQDCPHWSECPIVNELRKQQNANA